MSSREIRDGIDDLQDLYDLLDRAIVDEPPSYPEGEYSKMPLETDFLEELAN